MKITFGNLRDMLDWIEDYNITNGIDRQYGDKNPIKCFMVFRNDSWTLDGEPANYPLISRTYEFRNDNKYFIPRMLGSSIFADCCDGTDQGVRLDWYIHEWNFDYGYVIVADK